MSAPEYVFLISDLAGERRFAASVSKRLESLGALTHGDRRATESRNLSQFNVDNKYGRDALRTILRNIFESEYFHRRRRRSSEDEEAEQREKLILLNNALKNIAIHPPAADVNMKTFLNRILGIPVDLQNYLFSYFLETLDDCVDQAKRLGQYDLGIMGMCGLVLFNIVFAGASFHFFSLSF